MQDFARRMRWLADETYPEAEVVRVVLDNLNTHRRASLYETFPAEEARRIARRLEFHYTPKHGSWLNMAEIEFSVLSRSCLKQRLSALDTPVASGEWTYGVAVIVSQDSGFGSAVELGDNIAKGQDRQLVFESAFPNRLT